MRRIYKFTHPVNGTITMKMHAGAQIVSVGSQRPREVAIWAIVEDTAPVEDRVFVVYGTGHPCTSEQENYLGTVMDDPFVWHVFQEGKP